MTNPKESLFKPKRKKKRRKAVKKKALEQWKEKKCEKHTNKRPPTKTRKGVFCEKGGAPK